MKSHLWIAAALMLLGAVLLIAGVGASAVWIAAITVGVAVVAIDRIRTQRAG